METPKAVNHLGIAVRSIEEVRGFYENVLRAKFEGIEEVAEQKVRVAFYRIGDVKLELLEPTTSESTIAKFIEKKGEGLHHVAYEVTDIQARLDELKAEGVKLIDETPRMGAHHMKVAFLHPKASAGILTELCEPAH
jgi:methylmalonyl-CoA/ethylmalonyl-CoA epimerase